MKRIFNKVLNFYLKWTTPRMVAIKTKKLVKAELEEANYERLLIQRSVLKSASRIEDFTRLSDFWRPEVDAYTDKINRLNNHINAKYEKAKNRY